MDRKTYKKKTKGRKLRKRFLVILLPLLLVGFIAIGYSVSLYVKAQEVANDSYEEVQSSDKRDEVVDPKEDHVSILFLGVDESDKRKNASGFEGGASRSDAMILATLNNDDKSVKLTSIPRDTLAYIPEVGIEDKINHAHAFGGPKASMEAVEELLDVPVDYYVRMNFYAFIDVVEALNGVEVEVPFDMEEMNSNDSANAISLKEGRQMLNGEEALAFARSRSYDSDVARGGRQLEVMQAVLDRSASVGSIGKYSDVIEAIGNNMKTNMKFEDMRSFISYATNSDLKVDMHTLEGEAVTYNGIYYYEAYEEELIDVRAQLREHLEMPVENESDPYESPAEEDVQDPALENTEESAW